MRLIQVGAPESKVPSVLEGVLKDEFRQMIEFCFVVRHSGDT